MGKILLVVVAIIAVGGSAAGASVYLGAFARTSEEAPHPLVGPGSTSRDPPRCPVATAGGQLWRWGNVTVVIPEGSDVYVVRDIAPPQANPPDGGQVLGLVRGNSGVDIDADDGRAIAQQIAPVDQAAIAAVTATLRVGDPFAVGECAPWPYGVVPSSRPKIHEGVISYWEPDPAAGIALWSAIGDFGPGPKHWIEITNLRSSRAVDLDSGNIVPSFERIAPEDAEAFERWTQAIEVVGRKTR